MMVYSNLNAFYRKREDVLLVAGVVSSELKLIGLQWL